MTKQAAAFVFAAGETPQLWIDGVKNALAVTPGQPAGTTSVTDTLELGRGGRGSIGYWKGKCSLLALSSRRQPAAVLETFTRAFTDPQRVYSHGTVNRVTDAIASPVAGPAYGTAPPGQASAAIDLAAASYDPGGLALTCTAATVVSGNGGVSRSGNLATITPASNAVTGDVVLADYTIRNSSLKTSSGRIYVEVRTAVSTLLPKLQPAAVVDDVANWRTVGFAVTGSKSTHNSGNLRTDLVAAFGVAVGGDVIVLANGTYSGAKITVTRNGTAANRIMVRARNHRQAIINLQLDIDAEYWWFTGLELPWDNVVAGTSHNDNQNSILCRKKGLWVTNCSCTSAAFLSMIYDSAKPISNVRICYNSLLCVCPATADHMAVINLSTWDNDTRLLPTDVDIAWNKVTYGPEAAQQGRDDDSWSKRSFITVQHGKQASQMGRDFRVWYNHVEVHSTHMFYIKKNINVQYNYLKVFRVPFKGGGLSPYYDFTYRHGWNPTSPAYDTGGLYIGNYIECAGTVWMEINGSGCVINGNSMNGGGAGRIQLSAGIEPDTPPHDAAEHAQLVENIGFNIVVVGSNASGNTVGVENPNGRNGWPANVRIYKGAANWNPTISKGRSDAPDNMWTVMSPLYGTGNAAKVTTIAAADLTGASVPVGCD